MFPGVFVVLEGIDGSGKSTTAHRVQDHLHKRGCESLVLREPTEKTDASREIRRILRTVENVDAAVSRELLDLFLIDRVWDLKHQILPALRNGKVVLLDRYFLSTAAYQAESAHDVQAIMQSYLNDTRIHMPDLLIYLALPVEAALLRLQDRNERDVFEKEARLTMIAQHYQIALSLLRTAHPEIEIVEFSHALAEEDFAALADKITRISEKKRP